MMRAAAALLLLVGLAALDAHASAIKGHPAGAPAESVRSLKSLAGADQVQRLAAPVKQPAGQPQSAVLESSRKVFNDESIRRSAVKSAPSAPEAPVAQPAAPSAAAGESPAAQQPAEAKVEPKAAEPKVDSPAAPSDRSALAKEPLAQPVAAESAAPPAPVAAVPEPKQADHSQLQAKKDEPSQASAVQREPAAASAEPALHVEVPPPDPGLVLSEPIDSTTKLLIDLDEHVQKFLPAEDKQEPAQPAKEQALISGVDYSPVGGSSAEPSGKSALPAPYSSAPAAEPSEPIVPPMPSLEGVDKASAGPLAGGSAAAPAPAGSAAATRQASSSSAGHGHGQNQQQVISQLLDQLDSLQSRIQDTINQLVARRRYVMSALLRPMGTYVRRVRTNLERLQTRVNSLQAAAQSVGGNNSSNGQRPGGFVDAAAIETIRRRIDDISKRISDIVNRIRFSLTPTSAPMNSNGRK